MAGLPTVPGPPYRVGRLDARLQRLTLAQRILLGLAVLAMAGVAMAWVGLRGWRATERSLEQATASNAAATSAYELEINVVEMCLKVLKYLELREPQFRDGAMEDMTEFDTFLGQYEQSARSPASLALAAKARIQFAHLRALGLALMNAADTRRAQMAQTSNLLRRLGATDVSAALVAYAWEATPEQRAQLLADAASFERNLQPQPGPAVSTDEKKRVAAATALWLEARGQLDRIVKTQEDTAHDLARFLALRRVLDDLLDESIQVLAVASVDAARQSVAAARTAAMLRLLAISALAALLAVAIYTGMARAVRQAVGTLLHGAEEFARGHLEHRLPALGDRELDRVIAGFNRMAEELQEVTVSADSLRTSERKFRDILMLMQEGYYEADLAGKLTFVNPSLARTIGQSTTPMAALDIHDVLHAEAAAQVLEIFASVKTSGESAREVEVEIETPAGGQRVLACSAQLVYNEDGLPKGFRGLVFDITERKRFEQELRHQTLHDALTGLPNRLLFEDRLAQATLGATRFDGTCALLFLDLDNFKHCNDTLGHAAGDQLLVQIGPRLRGCIRESDTVARLGGDEFAVVLPGASLPQAERAAVKILAAFDEPFLLEGRPVLARASVGIAVCPLHARLATELSRRADIAMYAAKSRRTGYQVYATALDPEPGELELPGELGAALEQGRFSLHYQPKVGLRHSGVAGVEALARLVDSSDLPIGPAEFIPTLEKQGLMIPFTLWAIETAARQQAAWRAAGIRLPIAVNLSPSTLRNASFAGQVLAILDRFGGSGGWLELEITESTLMDNPQAKLERLKLLRARGVRLTIDDFGTGYSSLAYLGEFAPDALKIDRSFVRALTDHGVNDRIVHAVIELAHSLGMTVVAEGVEDEAVLRRLAELGCDEAQGFFLCEPKPADELDIWLSAQGYVQPHGNEELGIEAG
jgi:diguanylate cyclase (GGDEF)-like protein/PAS domain S-box-containing protein